jgi:lipoate-protein ligase A
LTIVPSAEKGMEEFMKSVHFTTGKHTGSWNMAFDRLLMELVRENSWDLVLRTYGWEPACVSIGKLQRMSREVNRDKLEADGYGIVRRPTGGRAVWHESELTYSIVASVDNPLVSGSITEALRKTSAPMVAALRSLGIEAAAHPLESHRAGDPRTAANPCFTSHGKWEIGTIDGRKLVGSAQARSRGVFLEHGSILFRNDQLKILDYLPEGTPPGMIDTLRHHLTGGIATVHEFAPDSEPEDMEKALHGSFSPVTDDSLEYASWRDLEGEHLEKLECECRNDL